MEQATVGAQGFKTGHSHLKKFGFARCSAECKSECNEVSESPDDQQLGARIDEAFSRWGTN